MPHAPIQWRPWRLTKPKLFKTSVPGLVEMKESGFNREASMQNLIEDNIWTLFPGLKLLGSQIRLAGGDLIPDTVAFDTYLNTFVVIEYKNKLNSEAVDQAKAYLTHMKRSPDTFVVLHSRLLKCAPRDRESFDWKKTYAIIMAPEFGRYQPTAFDDDTAIEMYEISLYDDHVLLIQRVSGGHERPSGPGKSEERGSGTPGGETVSMEQLYVTIRQRLLDAFPGAEVHKTKYYNGFRLPGGKYFCALAVRTSKIWLYYPRVRDNLALKYPGFVVNPSPKVLDMRKWRSVIRNEDDFNRALKILKSLDTGIHRTGPA